MNIANINYNDSSQCRKAAEPRVKENKDTQIKVRITKSDKEIIEEYCINNDLTVSAFIRMAIKEYFNK